MKIWFDTEFIEDGITIDLLSIGMIREDGQTYYAEPIECDTAKASDWVREKVLPHMRRWKMPLGVACIPRRQIASDIVAFAGEKPEFWAYYADYDWVALCQLFGTMLQLPEGWPMYCRDVKQLCDALGNPDLPPQDTAEHNALNDAEWTKSAWSFLQHHQMMASSPIEVMARAIEHAHDIQMTDGMPRERRLQALGMASIALTAYESHIRASGMAVVPETLIAEARGLLRAHAEATGMTDSVRAFLAKTAFQPMGSEKEKGE